MKLRKTDFLAYLSKIISTIDQQLMGFSNNFPQHAYFKTLFKVLKQHFFYYQAINYTYDIQHI